MFGIHNKTMCAPFRERGALRKKATTGMKKIYVGNLPFSATEEELNGLFAAHGDVESIALITDRDTGRPRGFGFVEMSDEGAASAIAALDGTEMGGRSLRVNEARPRRDDGASRAGSSW